MVRKQPISLKEKCLQLVSVIVWKFCYACALCIEVEHPLSVVTAKHVLSSLPQTVIQDIFNHILSSLEYKLFCRNHMEIARSNSEPPMNKLYWKRKFKRYQTNILYLVSLILGVDESCIRSIEFSCETEEEMFFVSKFGKNIHSMKFKNPTLWLTLSNFRMILGSASNIQELSLRGINYSEQYFRVIGEECNQLKVLKGVVVDKEVLNSDEYSNSGLTIQNLFMKLLFKSGNERNMCCDSLQCVHLLTMNIHEAPDFKITSIYNTVTLLINNLPNLKSLGDEFNLDSYLRSLHCTEITKTNLEIIYIEELTCDIIPILGIFCPKVKKMIVEDTEEIENQHQLSKFDFLEDLFVGCFGTLSPYTVQMLNKLVSMQWPTLRKLTLNVATDDLNITNLALHFPKITELDIQPINYIWDCKTKFKCLEKLKINLCDGNDISWFESFSNTITHLNVSCDEPFHTDQFQILLSIPFPCLESLIIDSFPYNFQFYTSVLKTLPKLRICDMSTCDEPDRTQHVQELSKFLKENNLECDIRERRRLSDCGF